MPPNMLNTEGADLLSSETSAVLEIDRSTLSRWVKDGKIRPSRKLPGSRGAFLFSRAEVRRVKRELDGEQRRKARQATRTKAAS